RRRPRSPAAARVSTGSSCPPNSRSNATRSYRTSSRIIYPSWRTSAWPTDERAAMFPWIPVVAVALLTAVIVASRRSSGSKSKTPEAPVEPDLRLPRLEPRDRHLLLLMIDGLPAGVFEDALAAGTLPNLARLFARRPTLR